MSMTEWSSHVAVGEGKPGAWTKKSNKNTFHTFYSKGIIRIDKYNIYIHTVHILSLKEREVARVVSP